MRKNLIDTIFLITLTVIGLFFWVMKYNVDQKICGSFLLVTQTILDISIFWLSIQKSFETINAKKYFFIITSAAFFFEILADISYHLIYNIFLIPLNSLNISLVEIPFILFLILQLVAFLSLFKNQEIIEDCKRLVILFPALITGACIIGIFVLENNWKIGFFSISGGYQLLETIIEALAFASFCMFFPKIKNTKILFMGCGFLVILASDYLIRSSVVEDLFMPNNLFEISWLAGLLMFLYGLTRLNRNELNKQCDFVLRFDSLQVQITSWNLLLFIVLVFLYISLGPLLFSIDIEPTLKVFPPLVIFLTPIAMLSSFFLSQRLIKPLSNFEVTMRNFFKLGPEAASYDNNDYGIYEYIEIKKFIRHSLQVLNDKIIAERKISSLAANVAHDIKSPLVAMEMILSNKSTNTMLSERNKKILIQSIHHIHGISQNLLLNYRKNESPSNNKYIDSGNQIRSIGLIKLIDSVINLKQEEWQNKSFSLDVEYQNPAESLWVKDSPIELRRILSNILNNAFEACGDFPRITLKISSSRDCISLVIKDNGKGIPEDKINLVLKGLSLKHEGKGLGLSYAYEYLKSRGGDVYLKSTENIGTEVTLQLVKIDIPVWFCNNLDVMLYNSISIVSRDPKIHNFLQNYKNSHQVAHFSDINAFNKWLKMNDILPSSVHFIDSAEIENVDGYEFLKQIPLNNSCYILTRDTELIYLQEFCQNLNFKMLTYDDLMN